MKRTLGKTPASFAGLCVVAMLFAGGCALDVSGAVSTDDGGGPGTGGDTGGAFTSTCVTPTNVFIPAGFTGWVAWGERSDGSAYVIAVSYNSTTFPVKTCALLLMWPGMERNTTPPTGAHADLMTALSGAQTVTAYALDVSPEAFGWAHNGLHRR